MKKINENQKVTLTLRQLKKLVKESLNDDWRYQVVCQRDPDNAADGDYTQVAKFDDYEDALELAMTLEKAVVSVSSHIGAVASFWVADRDGQPVTSSEVDM